MKKTGAELIAQERQRQIDEEGYTVEHDDSHQFSELAEAAMCYIDEEVMIEGLTLFEKGYWPWDNSHWKPGDTKSNLIKAGALIAAEIDRLQRSEDIGE